MRKSYIIGSTIFIIGIIAGCIITKSYVSVRATSTSITSIREKGYKYISPLLRVESPSNESNDLYNLERTIRKYIREQKKNDLVKDISVYFRDPNRSEWFVINPEITYSPASLIKVATAMTYYKLAEVNPSIFAENVMFVGTNMENYNFPPKELLISGQSYTVENLVERTLIYSDNDAFKLLLERNAAAVFQKLFDDLQVTMISPTEPDNFMTVQNYMSFFRTLYNATYLSDSNSEKLLELMTKAEFKEGIVSGVPNGILVAHKFGERTTSDQVKQLHDCGIIYAPKHPYMLCIMTRGDSYDVLKEAISHISYLTYQEITQN